jgi:hypothetical protein
MLAVKAYGEAEFWLSGGALFLSFHSKNPTPKKTPKN